MMVWMGNIACMREITSAYIILTGKPEGKKHMRDLGADEG
jgi:hypothetical protein